MTHPGYGGHVRRTGEHRGAHLASWLLAVVRAVEDAAHDVRHEHFLRVGRLYLTSSSRHFDAVRNGFEMGREYERDQQSQGGAR